MRILLAEDDPIIADGLVRTLKKAGHAVDHVDTGTDADLALFGQAYDLAILDVSLPDRSGLEFAQRLRELDRIPFIMLSAYSEPEMVEQATQAGALGYLVKPIDFVQLVPEVRAALARAGELQDLRDKREQLQQALDNERDISVAVGLLMAQRRIPRQSAFEVLRQSARQQRRRIVQVALDLIREIEQP